MGLKFTLLNVERRSNQSILEEINSEYSLKGLMLKLMLQYFGHLIRRTDTLEKTLILGKTEGRRRRGLAYGTLHMLFSLPRTISSSNLLG